MHLTILNKKEKKMEIKMVKNEIFKKEKGNIFFSNIMKKNSFFFETRTF